MNDLERRAGIVLQSLLVRVNLELMNFNDPDRKMVNGKINQIKNETELSMSNTAAQELFEAVKATGKIEGDIAEVGVFKGGSAKVICEAKGDRRLHLFDTFDGAPEPDPFDNLEVSEEDRFGSDLDAVRKYLANFPNVNFYKGLFPGTSGPVKDSVFSLVHLDTGLHRSTYDGLEFFYPRMNRGGLIISHDYSYMTGVRKAIDEFFLDKPEIVLGLSSYQCLMIKM
ncbi:MAG TPA: TylF/MycF/NovP-related O-methyltransferase [Methanomassiliicoccales archaeon]